MRVEIEPIPRLPYCAEQVAHEYISSSKTPKRYISYFTTSRAFFFAIFFRKPIEISFDFYRQFLIK